MFAGREDGVIVRRTDMASDKMLVCLWVKSHRGFVIK